MASHPSLACIRTLHKLHRGDVNSCAFSPEGTQVATGSSDRTALILPFSFDDSPPESGEGTLSLLGHSYHVNVCRFSPCGSLLATGSTDCTVRLWNTENGQCTGVLSGRHKGSVRGLAFSSDSTRLLSSAGDDSLCVWDVFQGACTKHWITDSEATLAACSWTSSNWHVIVGSSSGVLMIWDLSRTVNLQSVDAHDMGVSDLFLYNKLPSNEECVVSCGSDCNIKLWRLHVQGNSGSLTLVGTISGHTGPIYSISISPDQQYIVSGSADRTVRLWHIESRGEISRGEGHSGYITSCAFSPTGQVIVSGASDRAIRFWQLVNPDAAGQYPGISRSGAMTVLPKMPTGDPKSWSVEDVCTWLGSLNLAQYADAFRLHGIGGASLFSIDAKRLALDMSVASPADRAKILRGLNDLFPSDRSVPSEFICPISMEIMRDPVVAADGFSYERSAIVAWIAEGRFTSPMTNLPLTSATVVPNQNLRTLIHRQLEQWQPS